MNISPFDPARLKLVVFDFDGVVLESADIKTEAFAELFADYPDHIPAVVQHHLENQGVSRFTKFEWIYANLLGRPLTEELAEQLSERFSTLALHKILEAPFVNHCRELLQHLQESGIPAAVASGTPEAELRSIVQARGLEDYFVHVRGTPATKVDILLEYCAYFDVLPHEMLMVGDASTDYEAARAVGTQFYARMLEEGAAWVPGDGPSGPDLYELYALLAGLEAGEASSSG